MRGTLYRIKLYGHSDSDTELFCRNLAAILAIDEEKAQALLRNTPVVIKEGIPREKAEEFCKLIEQIRALCIIEPVDSEIHEDAVPATDRDFALQTRAMNEFAKKTSPGSWIWMAVLVVTAGGFLLFAGGSFISSIWSVYHQNRSTVSSPVQDAQSTTSGSGLEVAAPSPVSAEDLFARIDALKAGIESARFELAQAEEILAGLYKSPRSQPKEFEDQALIIKGLREKIRADLAQLQVLKGKLEEIE